MPPDSPTADGAGTTPSGDFAHAAGRRAARNTAVRAAGEIVGKLGSLVLLAVLARKVGDERLGVFIFALAWGEVAMTPVGLGIDQYILRRIAADNGNLDSHFWNAIYLKTLRGLPVVLGSIALVHMLDYPRTTELTVSIITLGLLFDTMARTPTSVFEAFERGELVAIAIVVQRMIAAVLGLAVLFAGFGVVAVAITFALGALVRLVLALALMRRRLRWPRWIRPADTRLEIRRKSLTFTAQDIFGLVLARADVLLLAALATDAVVGQYGAAYRLFEATTFINVALAGAFTAMFTYLGRDTTPTLAAVFQRSVKLALVLLLPIAMALGFLAEPICRTFFGAELASAGDSMRLLAPVVVLFPVMALCSTLVLSRSRPRRMVYTVAVAAVVNIALNVILIPPLEAEGAALAMLGSMVLYVAIALKLAVLEAVDVAWIRMLAAPLLAAVAMVPPLLALSEIWAIAAGLGAIVYLAVYAVVERVVDPDDLRFVVDLVRSRLPSRRRPEAGAV